MDDHSRCGTGGGLNSSADSFGLSAGSCCNTGIGQKHGLDDAGEVALPTHQDRQGSVNALPSGSHVPTGVPPNTPRISIG